MYKNYFITHKHGHFPANEIFCFGDILVCIAGVDLLNLTNIQDWIYENSVDTLNQITLTVCTLI